MKIYYKQLYAHKFDHVDEMDLFLEINNLHKTHTRRNRQFK